MIVFVLVLFLAGSVVSAVIGIWILRLSQALGFADALAVLVGLFVNWVLNMAIGIGIGAPFWLSATSFDGRVMEASRFEVGLHWSAVALAAFTLFVALARKSLLTIGLGERG